MCPPSLKFIAWVFELQIFKLRTLSIKVHTIISSTFLNSFRSTISRFNLYWNELIDMHLGLTLPTWVYNPFVVQNSSEDEISYLESPYLHLWVEVSSSAALICCDLKLQEHHFSSRKLSLHHCKIMFFSRSKFSLLKEPALSSTRTMDYIRRLGRMGFL